ncbi:hypothetical protein [Paenibacillus radicis (ex Xue et al. 2023)]|uniref:Uncharacterized protein n=1 Tax=Paenibacillus radicis (ex Xue et al. 2023) TaxID=2972489 RepID=A0ABT1YQQ6_9BACL|nr:hypothetical protein [Paenibacillus radicis (ex Xue et al. 2023)]MCR8634694.1 hypothetical protein [Paenibacillus radicis (ex Xue et al. 2023)]
MFSIAEPESEAAKLQRNMRQYLVEWCMINGDHTMLNQGDLLRGERDREPSSATVAQHPKSAGKGVLGHFGRRFV